MQRRSEPAYCAGEWVTWQVTSDEVQIYPRNDLVAHDLTEGECVCGPLVELVEVPNGRDAYLFTHHALDGRP